MRLIVDADGFRLLRVGDDKSALSLIMEYDDQLEHYGLAIRGTDNSIEPLDPIKRRLGEDNEIYFDRASALAHRIFLNKLCERIEAQSRSEQARHILGQIDEKITHTGLIIAHWDNDEPSEADLQELLRIFRNATIVDDALGDLS